MPFGLLKRNNNSPVPLRSVRVESTVLGYTARVVSRLEYENEEGNPIEAVFTFPLDESATVVDLSALIDGRKIVGIVKEKGEAQEAYDLATASGQSAFLMESDRRDIFTVSVGNLPPRKKATVEITFIMELPTEHDGSVRFNLPSVLTPRYHAASSNPAESTNPTADVTYLPASIIPYTFSFEMRIEADVDDVTSPTHQLMTKHAVDDVGYSVTLVQLAEEHKFDKDVVLTIKPKNTHQPHAVIEMGAEGGVALLSDPAVTLNYFPDFSTTDAVSELIFVIDRSGSMSGGYIEAAKETMMLFLKSIPDDCYFDIVGFGTSHEKLFKKSVAYNQENLDAAMQYTKSLQANLGGTELLPPLREIFKMPSVKGLPKQIFVLTDGAVSNTYSVIEEVKKNAHNARCFAVGIGSGASTELVRGIAEAGKGSSEFIQAGERMQPKVMRMLKRALTPSISDVHVSWSLPGVIQTPSKVPPVFSGDRLIIYGFLPNAKDLKGSASLNGYIGTEKFGLSIDFDVKASESGRGKAVHQLAIKSLIRDVQSNLNDKDLVKKRLGGTIKSDEDLFVKLSTSANVICSHTSFVAIDEESEEPVTGSMERRHIPMAEAEDCFGGMAFNSFSAPPPPPAAGLGGFGGPLGGMFYSRGGAPPPPPPAAAPGGAFSFGGGPLPPPGGGGFSFGGAPMRSALSGGPPPPPPGGGGLSFGGAPMRSALSGGPPPPPPQAFGFAPPPAPQASSSLFGAVAAAPPASRNLFGNRAEIGSGDSRPGDAFLTIVSLQQASGAWPLDSAVARLLNKSVDELAALSPFGKDSSAPLKSIWATAIVLTWLETKCAGSKDEWDLMAKKATKWAKKQTFPGGMTWINLLQAAEKLF